MNVCPKCAKKAKKVCDCEREEEQPHRSYQPASDEFLTGILGSLDIGGSSSGSSDSGGTFGGGDFGGGGASGGWDSGGGSCDSGGSSGGTCD